MLHFHWLPEIPDEVSMWKVPIVPPAYKRKRHQVRKMDTVNGREWTDGSEVCFRPFA